MEEVKRLQRDGVPTLKKVWIHNNDVVGIGEDGEPLIIATLVGNETGAGPINPERQRAPRRKKEEEVVTGPTEE